MAVVACIGIDVRSTGKMSYGTRTYGDTDNRTSKRKAPSPRGKAQLATGIPGSNPGGALSTPDNAKCKAQGNVDPGSGTGWTQK